MKILVVGDFQGQFPEKLKKRLKKEEFDIVVMVGDYSGIKEWMPWVKENFRRAHRGLPGVSVEEFFGEKGFSRLVKKDFIAGASIIKYFDSLGKQGAFIFGNGDDFWYTHPAYSRMERTREVKRFLKKVKNIKEINYGASRVEGIDFVGFGGYMDIEAYFNKNHLKDQNDSDVKERIKRHKIMGKKLFSILKKVYSKDRKVENKIFVFHYPPIGAFDIIGGGWKGNPMRGKSAGVRFYNDAIKKYKPRLVLCGHMHEYQGAKKLGKALVVNPGDAEQGKYAIIEWPSLKVKFVK